MNWGASGLTLGESCMNRIKIGCIGLNLVELGGDKLVEIGMNFVETGELDFIGLNWIDFG